MALGISFLGSASLFILIGSFAKYLSNSMPAWGKLFYIMGITSGVIAGGLF